MSGWLPRGFRSRVLLAILFVGTVLIVFCWYTNLQLSALETGTTRDAAWFRHWWKSSKVDCPTASPSPESNFVDTSDVYPTLDFRVPDNGGMGFWNEVLESRYREVRETWKDLPLEVIVIPHSHVDPGWLRTYNDYSENVVDHILDNMVEFLENNDNFTFIWSEMSFLSSWWMKKNEKTQNSFRNLLRRRKLEIVTGGWVMADEATTSYFSIIDQLVEGHQWLQNVANFTPKHGWSVDVFGHSASMPYILAASGITEMVILRAHYSWKSYLAKKKGFDFFWDQPFPSPRILCHMGPSDLYSFKHTCGPDQLSCLNFDFRRVGGEYTESTADDITEKNIELKANQLVSQYGRYASLFTHNVLLVPLGDDFRYNLLMEWNQQFENYQKIFDFVNSRKDWNVHMKFGTLSDYFNEVNKRIQNNVSDRFPISIRGDFFPYGDIYANAKPSYWTGFYTTRPFFKKLSQELEHWLRSAEIIYSFTKNIAWNYAKPILLKDYKLLVSARQQLALFQHHDAITGTARENVMADYGKRLHNGIVDAMSVVSHLTQTLFMEKSSKTTWTSQVYLDGYRSFWNIPTKKVTLQVSKSGRKIIIFNSLAHERMEIVNILVRTPDVIVLDSKNKHIPCQINPTWKSTLIVSNNMYELVFVANLKPLSYTVFKLVSSSEKHFNSEKARISLFLKDDSKTQTKNSPFKMEKPVKGDIILESTETRVLFSASGNLKEIYMKKLGVAKPINIDLKAYFPKDYRSGAYLFQPDIPNPIPLTNLTDNFPVIYVIRGSILSELSVMYHNFLKFTTRIYHFDGAPPGIQLEISPDIGNLGKNIELIMQIKSDISNNGIFYTDSNGLQNLRRKYVQHLPIEGNYYPITKSLHIEDESYKLSFLVPYSHGVTSPFSGALEVMLDRRIPNDDGRGLSEGVLDNKLFTTTYWLMLEKKQDSYQANSLSPQVATLSLRLQYPIITLMTDSVEAQLTKSDFSFLTEQWPSYTHLINMRTLPSSESYDSPSNDSLMIILEENNCKMNSYTDKIISNFNSTFMEVKVKSIVKTFLTGVFPNQDQFIYDSSPPKLQSSKITFS